MGSRAKIVVRRVYVWKASTVGFLYGLTAGFILIAPLLGLLWVFSRVQDVTLPNLSWLSIVIFSFLSVFSFSIACAVGGIFSALLYNLIAKISGGLHVDLEEMSVEH